MRLAVVIVNYKSCSLTVDCLRSLEPEVSDLGDVQVFVVENSSGEADALRTAIDSNGWGNWCRLLDMPDNRGFAAGNNAAIDPILRSDSPPEYFLLLNPDTVVHPNAISELIDFMQTHPTCGIAGSRLEDPDGSVQRSAFRFPSVFGEFETAARTGPVSKILQRWTVAPESPTSTARVDWVAGASMLVRRAVFEVAGLMDDKYFLYFEEVDFCHRAKKAGWDCWYVPASRVVHLVGQSSGVTNSKAANRRRPQYWFESRQRYFVLHRGRLSAMGADIACLCGGLIHGLRCALSSRSLDLPAQFSRDLLANSVLLHPFRKFG